MNVGSGGLSMRRGLAPPPPITKQEVRANYFLYMKRRNTGLLSGSGTLNNNI